MPKDPRLERAGVEGFNKPKKTPNHPTKSHVVVAKSGDQVKTIRFGQQGVSGSPKREGESSADKARRASFKARHSENIAKGKMSAAYWADKVKWTIGPIGVTILMLTSQGAPNAQLQLNSYYDLPELPTAERGQR
jgi:hypothetical protein